MAVEVSIIIPAYKAENTIEHCVESLIRTGYKDMEIILVEDGSPDQTWEVCRRLAEAYPVVRSIKNAENRGVSYTRNRGLELASGRYVMFADSDDWVDAEFLAIPMDIMKRENCDMVVFGYVNHDELHNQRTEEFGWKELNGTKRVTFEEELLNIYQDRLLQQLWNKVFQLSIIRENQIQFDEQSSMGEDFRFILAYLRCCKQRELILSDRILYHYNRDNESSLMYTFEYKDVEEPLKDMRVLYQLAGWDEEKIQQTLQEEREKLKVQYAYFIMHSPSNSKKEKKEKITAIGGKSLYSQMERLYYKEKISKLLKR